MDDNQYLARVALGMQERGSPFVLASIISQQGSSPRHAGTKMIIGKDRKIYGTIGGSLVEATAIKESQSILAEGRSRLIDFDLAGTDVHASGMICGGRDEILLDYISPSRENSELFRSWLDNIVSGQEFFFITYLRGQLDALEVLGHSILTRDGSANDSIPLSESVIETLKAELHGISTTSIILINDIKLVVNRIRKLKTLYCFGAGHVALPTAHLAALVGFRVVVVDDRKEFANPERFPEAAKVVVVPDFDHIAEIFNIDKDSFVVIVTRGHRYDRVVLEQALKTPAGYIGMISSRKKREAVYEALLAEGVTREQLDSVHSPIGINIGGETPEEIAVSIVAELISVRSKQQR